MNIVFFGTPDYVIPILDMLHREFKESGRSPILAVVTQPPRKSGRDKTVTFSAVDTWTFKKNERVKEKSRHIPIIFDSENIIKRRLPADVGILAAYGKILSKEVVNYFPHGIINIHPSLLPEFRGASPIQAAIATGKEQIGVSFMKMDEEMDHGPIISSFKEEVLPTDTLDSLRTRVFNRSAEVLKTLLPAYMSGKTKLHKQDHEKSTYTKIVTKDHGFIDWKYLKLALKGKKSHDAFDIPFVEGFETTYSPETIDRYIRALTPWPGVWTIIPENEASVQPHARGKRMKIITAKVLDSRLELEHVQLAGKNQVDWQTIVKQ